VAKEIGACMCVVKTRRLAAMQKQRAKAGMKTPVKKGGYML